MEIIPLLPLFTLLLTTLLIKVLMPASIKLGLVDKPNERKNHQGDIPNIGGFAMFLALAVSCLLFIGDLNPFISLGGGILVLVVIGLLDDHFDLSVKARFYTQIAAALIMAVAGDIAIVNIGNIFGFGEIPTGIFAIPFTVFFAVGAINALNMSDGMDGLAGSIALVTFCAMAALAYIAGIQPELNMILLYIPMLCGFLLFNARIFGRRKAQIFMGDAGSMFLGLSIAWFAVALTQGENPAMRPVTALWLFAVPLLDTCSIMLRRICAGQSPFKADRNHLHHILNEAGFNVNRSLAIIIGFHGLLALVGVFSEVAKVPEFIMAGLFALTYLVYYSVVFKTERLRTIINSPAGQKVPYFRHGQRVTVIKVLREHHEDIMPSKAA